MSDHCDLRGLMSSRGVRWTDGRRRVLEVLSQSLRAMTAGEILDAVRAHRGMNKVTLYRILEEFIQRDILRRVSLEGRSSHYEMACEHHPPHPHFQCRSCGEVQCMDPVPLERVWEELGGAAGNRADRIEIHVAGVCAKCQGRN